MGWWISTKVSLFFLLLHLVHGTKRPLNNFIRHHERLNYDVSDVHSRMKRALDLSPFANVHIKFKAMNKNFTLHLQRNHDIFHPNFKIIDGYGKKIPYDYSRFVHGDVEGFHKSHVIGIVNGGRFEGSIHLHNDKYHVEPAEKYFKDDSTAVHHSVIYSHFDVEHNYKIGSAETPQRPSTLKGSSLYKHMEAEKKKAEESKENGKKRYRRAPKNADKNTCNFKLVADHLFMKKFVRRETAIDQMVLHYQAVEYIFRNQTFNLTNKDNYGAIFQPQGIGFRIKEVHVWSEDSVPKSIAKKHISVYRLLELFSRMNHSSACLAYLFTDRSFDNGVLGLAYVAYRYGQPGGICDPYAKYGDIWKTYNTGVVSFRLYNREAPPVITEITLAHELGHSFGAQHDPPTQKCRSKDGKGNYIMYDKATPGYLENNQRFSSCSIQQMIPVIKAKGLESTSGCFTDRYWAICGNGAHEEGEICDCGTVSTCMEQCCTPYGSSTGTPCTLQNEAYECSPSRGPCCLNATCTKAREHLKCFDGTECQESVQCDGLHVHCPKKKFKSNLTLCDKDRSVCINGFCQGSLCLKYGYEGCQCPNMEDKCKVCCLYNGACTSSHKIPEMPNTTLSRGTPCNYYKGYCDALGVCEDIDMDGPMRMLYYTFFTEEGIKIWFSRYWYVVLLGSILILCMLTAFVYYCQAFTPTNNPRLNNSKPHKAIRRRRKQATRGFHAYQPGTMPQTSYT